jgi:hypothetical protein
VGVLKKRVGAFDSDFHYFSISSETGIALGETVTDMSKLI